MCIPTSTLDYFIVSFNTKGDFKLGLNISTSKPKISSKGNLNIHKEK
jgi:hypothetical protein